MIRLCIETGIEVFKEGVKAVRHPDMVFMIASMALERFSDSFFQYSLYMGTLIFCISQIKRCSMNRQRKKEREKFLQNLEDTFATILQECPGENDGIRGILRPRERGVAMQEIRFSISQAYKGVSSGELFRYARKRIDRLMRRLDWIPGSFRVFSDREKIHMDIPIPDRG